MSFTKFALCIYLASFLGFLLSGNNLIANENRVDYDSIDALFRKNELTHEMALKYASNYLEKAKANSDLIHMAWGYYYMSGLNLNNTEIGLLYADSIIELSKKIKNNRDFPLLGYSVKSQHLCAIGDYKEALDLQLKCYEMGLKNGDENFILSMKSNIACTRRNLGEKVDFLPIYKELYGYIKNSPAIDTIDYVITLYNLSYEFLLQEKYDSAIYYTNIGLKISLEKKLDDKYGHGLALEGMCLYHKGAYQASIDSIKKGMEYSPLNYKLGLAYLYLGKCEMALNNSKEAISNFKKVDSLNFEIGLLNQQQMEIYPALINYFAQKEDYENQLIYTNKLLKLDSQLDSTRSYVIIKAREKYEVPQLVKSKNELIEKLRIEREQGQWLLYGGITISFIVVLLVYLRYRKIKTNENNESENEVISEKKEVIIPEEIQQRVIQALNDFEQANKFLNKKYTLGVLAKELKTNSVYLSKIVNDYKKMNLTNYLNNLRVDYAIHRIKTDKIFRTYSIEAIASECGFNTAQSFSKAFQRKTNLNPSSFIKELDV